MTGTIGERMSLDSRFKRGSLITSITLLRMNACKSQIYNKFKKEWPDGCKMYKKNLIRAAEIGLDMQWFGGKAIGYWYFRNKFKDLSYTPRFMRLRKETRSSVRKFDAVRNLIAAHVIWNAIKDTHR